MMRKLLGLIDPKVARISLLSVGLSSDFNPPENTYVTTPFNDVSIDTGGYYDTALYRWTPPRGFFIVYMMCIWRKVDTWGHHVGIIYANGSELGRSRISHPHDWPQSRGCLGMGETDGTVYIDTKVAAYKPNPYLLGSTRLYGISLPKERG